MSKIRIFTYMLVFVMFSAPFLGASHSFSDKDLAVYSIQSKDSVVSVKVDSSRIRMDSIPTDSVPKKKSVLDAIVEYTANDSIILTSNNWGHLYGDGEVKYTTISLKAEKISMSMDSSIVTATYGLDSIGEEFGYPVFADAGTDYEAKNIRYNFKSKKGYTKNIITQQGEGYMTAETAKKMDDDSFFMCDGRYTTCDDPTHPHFYLALKKAKVRPKKNVITGPAYLVIEGLPLPIGLPFGFFPFSDKYSSGVIMPSPGDEMERGFFLRDGGYYFAINDNIDLALTGEIYTKGSWGMNAKSSYKKRYKYSGAFDAGYLVTKIGDKDIPEEYSVAKDLKLTWTHSQDPKANMYRTLSASVNFSTSSYDRNQLNNLFNPATRTQNTKSSTVNLTQRIPNSLWSLSASMNVNQRSSDSTISMTLPNMTATMSRTAPFKRKEAIGPERWYEKIQMSYNGEFRNSITTKENKLFKSNIGKDWQHAMKHSIPVSATFNVLDHLNITPSINYTERWYTEKVEQEWDSRNGRPIPVDTTSGFHRLYDFNASLGFQTKLYGFFNPLFSKSTTIRHVFTPSISLNYSPDFGHSRFGYYQPYNYLTEDGEQKSGRYSPYASGMFGVPTDGAQGAINFSFENNIEMKLPTTDTVKKISLIDNLGIGFNYNMMADSMKWSDISMNVRLKLSKSLTVNLNTSFDTYTYDAVYDKKDTDRKHARGNRVNKLRISEKGSFGRMRYIGYSISPSFNQDTFNKLFGKGDKKSSSDDPNLDDPNNFDLDPDLAEGEETPGASRGSLLGRKKDDGEYDADGYVKNEVKWNLGLNYSFNYAYDVSNFDPISREYKYKLVQSLSFSGSIQPTKNWSFNFSASYDFDTKSIPYMNMNLTRNLHCWAISGSVIPVGPYKSYFVTLRANSSMLQDLKYEKRKQGSSYDPSWD